jgi:D-lactate dehydrogenase (cytochrome)
MYLRNELGDGTLKVMKTLKNALDPRGIMNPGKVSLSWVGRYVGIALIKGV